MYVAVNNSTNNGQGDTNTLKVIPGEAGFKTDCFKI